MPGRLASLAIWMLLAAAAAWVVTHARYTTDLSAFLPDVPTRAQRVLVEQLRDGLVSRLVLIDIEGGTAAARSALSDELARRLRADPAFRSVANGDLAGLDRDREFVYAHRYLLSDQVGAARFTVAGLSAAIGDGIEFLASPVGLVARDLFVHDPTGETLRVLGQLQPSAHPPRTVDGRWVSADGSRALLIAETTVAGSDTDGQERAVGAIRTAFTLATAAIPAGARPQLRLTGPGVFAVEARATIKQQALRLSLLSSCLIAALLVIAYRSLAAVGLGLLPVLSGALAGVAAVALGFGIVHGITLGFGGTLIGEAVDYSVYLFVQSPQRTADDATRWTRTLWPTVRLGMLTSVIGFASLLPSAFPGLAQLGLYSIAGLLAAGLVTRFVLPGLVPARLELGPLLRIGSALSALTTRSGAARPLLWLVPLAAGAVLYAHRDRLWNHELAALSPVPAEAQALDGALRADLGAPDVRTLVVLEGRDQESVLRGAERLGATLEGLVADGTIGGYQSPSRYLPSIAMQDARRASLPPAAELTARIERAVAGLPVRAARLQPFAADVEAARTAAPLTRADLAGTTIAAGVDALLLQQAGRWVALMPLEAPGGGAHAGAIDVARVAGAVATARLGGATATVLDLKAASDSLYSGYLSEALHLSLVGAGAIVLLLLVTLRSAGRVLRVLAPLGLAVLTVLAGFALAGRALTILHLVGLLLVMAVGSNYALFFDRGAHAASGEPAARMLASLVLANLTTVIAFGTLALSTVPVLAALGATVAPGAWPALVYAALLARRGAALPVRA